MKKKKKNHKTYIKGKQLGTELSLKSQTKNSGNNQPDNVIYWEDKDEIPQSLCPNIQGRRGAWSWLVGLINQSMKLQIFQVSANEVLGRDQWHFKHQSDHCPCDQPCSLTRPRICLRIQRNFARALCCCRGPWQQRPLNTVHHTEKHCFNAAV